MSLRTKCMPMVLALTVAVILGAARLSRAADPRRAAVVADPVSVILDAVASRPLVALSEGQHWNEQGHRFRLKLIQDPRFVAAFDDIVVEFGSSRYQTLMDRFVAGADVARDSLRQAWQNTMQPT